MDCPECEKRENEEKRKEAIEERYNEGINLLREASDKLDDAYKLFEKLRENPDITLHDAHQRSDGSFCIRDFIKEFNEDVFKMGHDLEMFIYEKEMEEC